MIQANAKCIVNGPKVNEIAGWVNQFIKLTQEEIEIVDTNNTPGRRWFLTGQLAGDLEAGAAEDGDRNNLGGTSGGALGSSGGNGGGGGNLDKLNMAAAAPLNQGGEVAAPINIGGGGAQPNIMAAAAPGLQQQPAIGGGGGGGGGGGRRSGGGGGGSANMISVGGGGQPPAATSSTPTTPTTPTAPTAPTSQPIAPTTEPTAPPPAEVSAPPPAPSSEPITSDTTAGTDAEFVDWRAAEKVRIKQKITAKNEALKRLVSSGASQDQISAARAEISDLIMEYDRVSKL